MDRKLDFKEKLLKFIKSTKKNTDKHVWITLAILVVFMYGAIWVSKPSEAVENNTKDDSLVTATMVGDIMLGRNVEKVTNRQGQDYLFRNVESYFKNADYSTANFDHPVTVNDEYPAQDKPIVLRTDEQSVKTLKNLNFSVLNVANSHSMDYLEEGLNDTVKAFNQSKMDFVGMGGNLEEASNINYQTVNGIKIATLGFTDTYTAYSAANDNDPGILPAKPEIFIPLIQEAKEKANLVVVHAHWGEEYDTTPSPRQKGLAKAMADAGADIILGHHPHVLQPIDTYKNTVIFYSLGNFVFDQGWSASRESALVQYKLKKDGTARFEVTPLLIKEATPTLLSKWDAYYKEKIFKRLTKTSSSALAIKEENNKLVFTVDHSRVVKKGLAE
ncbi:CapA family protein [Priestia megaterium]|uniref:CapA family protein n=1 Tax=Priestia megaterium TaxID=1404 RepID=UPI000BF2A4C3|nr:CapA family protein [Priestia megaterium]PFI89339.1 capsular biosynthesis protein [Priestia megaterium]PGR12144.1 capsular biosynthesis protein [Priestia megaterium]